MIRVVNYAEGTGRRPQWVTEELCRTKTGRVWWSIIPTLLLKIGYYRPLTDDEEDDEDFRKYVAYVIALRYAVHLS